MRIASLTCELDHAVRQTAELVVRQVQFLQTGELAQAGGQALQLVVGQVLKPITGQDTSISQSHTRHERKSLAGVCERLRSVHVVTSSVRFSSCPSSSGRPSIWFCWTVRLRRFFKVHTSTGSDVSWL